MTDCFSSIIGHEKIKEFLINSFNKGQVAHAYLFCGPENVGKTKAAACFSAMLLGACSVSGAPRAPETEHDDFQCLKNNPDFTLIEREINDKTGKMSQNVTIGQIRDLRERLQSTSFLGGRKVVVIKEAERLTLEAANAFLKNLEEPRGDAVIIILATDPANLPATIASRCQIVRFHSVNSEIIKKCLVEQGASGEKAEAIMRFSGAKPGLALRIFKDKDLFDFYQKQTENFAKILGLPLSERLVKTREMFEEKEVDKLRDKAYNILSVWMVASRCLMRQTLDAAAVEKIHFAALQIRANVNPKLVMENLMINL
jgi:DNA polymerase III delta prime subunit